MDSTQNCLPHWDASIGTYHCQESHPDARDKCHGPAPHCPADFDAVCQGIGQPMVPTWVCCNDYNECHKPRPQ